MEAHDYFSETKLNSFSVTRRNFIEFSKAGEPPALPDHFVISKIVANDGIA